MFSGLFYFLFNFPCIVEWRRTDRFCCLFLLVDGCSVVGAKNQVVAVNKTGGTRTSGCVLLGNSLCSQSQHSDLNANLKAVQETSAFYRGSYPIPRSLYDEHL